MIVGGGVGDGTSVGVGLGEGTAVGTTSGVAGSGVGSTVGAGGTAAASGVGTAVWVGSGEATDTVALTVMGVAGSSSPHATNARHKQASNVATAQRLVINCYHPAGDTSLRHPNLMAYNETAYPTNRENPDHSICRKIMFRQTQPALPLFPQFLRALAVLISFALTVLIPGSHIAHAAAVTQEQSASEITRDSTITTIVGNGIASGSGDGGPATQATLNTPASIAIDAAGNVYVADAFNHRVRRVTPDGTITALVGTGQAGFDGDGAQAIDAQLRTPLGVAVDSAGSLYIADTYNHRIRKVAQGGIISTIAGTGASGFGGDGGPGTAAMLSYPTGIAVAPNGTLYIADTRNHRVRKLALDGTITTVAGTGAAGFKGDGGPAALARLNSPRDVAVSRDGNLYIVDRENRRVRMVDSDGVITTVVGTGSSGFNGDRGEAIEATLRAPYGIAVDAQDNLYIADTFNHRVRKVDPDGSISTVAGSDRFGFSGDGFGAGFAALHYPLCVAVDIAGNLYIADTYNHRIRKVWSSADTEPTPNLFL